MKGVGYLVAVVGLAIMAVSFVDVGFTLGGIDPAISSVVGIILVIVGVFMANKGGGSSKISQAEEVPIYEGKGKNRRIVGYMRESSGKKKKK